jgi:hypothetical protein
LKHQHVNTNRLAGKSQGRGKAEISATGAREGKTEGQTVRHEIAQTLIVKISLWRKCDFRQRWKEWRHGRKCGMIEGKLEHYIRIPREKNRNRAQYGT